MHVDIIIEPTLQYPRHCPLWQVLPKETKRLKLNILRLGILQILILEINFTVFLAVTAKDAFSKILHVKFPMKIETS